MKRAPAGFTDPPPLPPAPQFRVVFSGTSKGKGRVFFNGVEVQHVRMIDAATTASLNDVVRSRISIELVGEVISVEHTPDPGEEDDEAPTAA